MSTRSTNWYTFSREQFVSKKNLKMSIPFDPELIFLVTWPKEICTKISLQNIQGIKWLKQF